MPYDYDSISNLNPKPFIRREAEHVARHLLVLPGITMVYLYGSLSRGRDLGNDLDLILETENDQLYRAFVRCTLDSMDRISRQSWSRPAHRLEAIRQLFPHGTVETTREKMARELGRPASELLLDILVMPPHWKDRLSDLRDPVLYTDPEFLLHVASDAIVVAKRPVFIL